MTGNGERFGAVLFDCDGVLVDSEPHSVAAWMEVLEGLGHPATAADVEACTGLGFPPTRQALASLAPLPSEDELWPMLLHALERSFDRGLAVFEDAVALLAAVRERGLPTAVVSGSPRSRLDLTLGCAGLAFEVSVAGGETPPKPAPDPYLAAAARLGEDPAACLVVEDTPTGVRSGVAAGARVVAVVREGAERTALREAGASQVVERLTVDLIRAP